MLYKYIKSKLPVLILALVLTSFAVSEASAIKVTITIWFGEVVKGKCDGSFGICDWEIDIELRKALDSGIVAINGDAVVEDNNLIITLKDKLPDNANNRDGKVVFKLIKNTKLPNKMSRMLKYKNIVLKAGSYSPVGTKLKIDIFSMKPLEEKEKEKQE